MEDLKEEEEDKQEEAVTSSGDSSLIFSRFKSIGRPMLSSKN